MHTQNMLDTYYEKGVGWLRTLIFVIIAIMATSAFELKSGDSIWENTVEWFWRKVESWVSGDQMVEPAGTALVGVAVWGQNLYNSWRPRKVGIYGAAMVGKTTLDRYMTTPGEMEEIPDEERTGHMRLLGKYLLPKPTRKRISWKGDRRVVYSADLGGQERFWSLWIDDMVARQVEAVVYMFDERAFKGGDDALQQIAGFKYLVDCIINRQYRYRTLKSRWKGKKYAPRLVMLVANKADRFFDETAAMLWQQNRIGEHKVFDPFRDDLVRLQKAGVPTRRSFMATRIGWNVETTLIDLLSAQVI